MREYERRREESRHRLSERLAVVYEKVAGYRELDERVAAMAVKGAKRYLDGNEAALAEAKAALDELTKAKEGLLDAAGFPKDYLSEQYKCPDCADTGFINHQKCPCLKQAIIDLLYQQSGIRGVLERENFDRLVYDYHSGEDLTLYQKAVARCQAFCDGFNESGPPAYQNLFLYGTIGTGKTFLSSCIAKRIIDQGYSVIYYTASDFFATISRYTFDFNNKEGLQELREDLSECDVLIIDDLGTEYTNDFTVTQLFSFINIRHVRRKALVISSNLSLEQLKNLYSERIFSRITSNFELLRLSGGDIRMKKKLGIMGKEGL
jgi:DNA replication protein DnaC